MKKAAKGLIISIILLAQAFAANAQTDTEFWFCVPQMTAQHEQDEPKLYLTNATNKNVTVTIEMPCNTTGFAKQTIPLAPYEQNNYNFKNYFNDESQIDRPNIIESGCCEESCIPQNKGIHITSTDSITAYLQRGKTNNCDIWALKGKNAFGTYFIIPGEDVGNQDGEDPNNNQLPRMEFNCDNNHPGAWYAIDIVAVENCDVDVTLPQTGLIYKWPTSINQPTVTSIKDNGKTVTFHLNKGQTLNLQAASRKKDDKKKLIGTTIKSSGKIVVQWKDDSLYAKYVSENAGGKGTSWDAAGDQLVPVELAGKEYIVMRGQLADDGGNNRMYENVYFMATETGTTTIEFKTDNGESLSNTTLNGIGKWGKLLLNSGNMEVNPKKNYNAVHIKANKNIIVWHISGSSGAEVGGAILPTIQGCTGSEDVTVCRSTTDKFDFWLNIMCKEAYIDDFIVTVGGNDYEIPYTWFDTIPGTGWCYLNRDHMKFSSQNGNIPAVGLGKTIRVKNIAFKKRNETGLFHLAVINGDNNGSCQYGYFSSFDDNQGKAVTVSQEFESDYTPYCYGDTITLRASGGRAYTWEYTQGPALGFDTTFVSDADRTCDSARVHPPTGTNVYQVRITRRCYKRQVPIQFGNITLPPQDTIINVWTYGYGKITSDFEITELGNCSPKGLIIQNKSTGASLYSWQLDNGTNSEAVSMDKDYGKDTIYFENNTPLKANYTLSLESSIGYNCPCSASKSFSVCPNVTATITPDVTNGCQPLKVNFTNTFSESVDYAVLDFGDGSEKKTATSKAELQYLLLQTHIYYNASIKDTIYYASIYAKDMANGGGCDATDTVQIKVPGNVKALYSIDKSTSCSPLEVTFTNYSIGDESRTKYTWNEKAKFGTPANGTIPADNSAKTNFTLEYINQGTDYVQYSGWELIAIRTNSDGTQCKDTMNGGETLTIYPEFKIKYSIDNATICHGDEVTFTNESNDKTDGTQFKWDLGDGTSHGSTMQNSNDSFKHKYEHFTADYQHYQTTLSGESKWGCKDSCGSSSNSFPCHIITVSPYVNPNFTIDKTSGCSPLTVHVVNNTPAHASKAYGTWTYSQNPTQGAVQVSNEADLTFVNKTGVTQTIRITLTDQVGSCPQKVYYQDIEVFPEITAKIIIDNPTPDPGGNAKVCDGTTVSFKNESCFTDQSTTPSNYQWSFGDGATMVTTSNSALVSHLFENTDENTGTTAKKYTVQMTASANGCTAKDEKEISVYPKVHAAFTAAKYDVCAPEVVNLKNSSSGADRYTWTFSDKPNVEVTTLNTDYTITNTTDQIQSKVVTLTVYNSQKAECNAKISKTFYAYPTIVPSVDVVPDKGCGPLDTKVQQSVTSPSVPYTFHLDFGDQITDETGRNEIDHTFHNTGSNDKTYTVKLTVTNNLGCSKTTSKTVTVYPEITAAFNYEKETECSPMNVNMINSSTNGTQFKWKFGYGSDTVTTTKATFKHKYVNTSASGNEPSNYTIKMVAIDANHPACRDSITKNIEIHPQLKLNFIPDTTNGCNPLNVKFDNKTTGGDVSYQWDFGDSQSSAEESPEHLFRHFKQTDQTYNVKMTSAQTATGCINTIDQDIKVWSYVHAKFGINETVENSNGTEAAVVLGGCTPFDVTITDSSKLNNAGTWYWDFGDGNTSTARQPSSRVYTNDDNTYPLENKNYTIYLKVTNDHGCWHDTAQTIAVYPRSVPDFTGNFTGCEPLTVNFEDNSVVDSKTQYFWTFSDGSTIVDKPPFSKIFHNYDYENTKKYEVNLKTTTQYNCTDEITKEIEVYAKPLARFIPLMDRACPPFEAEFMNTSIGTNLTYNWDFDNGTTISTTSKDNQKVEYSNDTEDPITFNVELITESDQHCLDTMVNPMITFPNVIVDFSFDTAGCSPHTIKVKNLSTKTTTNHLFDFGEGSTSVADEPSFTYYNTTDNDQTLTITYIGSSKYQCTDTIKKNVTVYINPNVDFVAHTPSQRYPDDTVYFENYTQNGPWSYQWDFGDGNTLKTDEKYFMYKYGKWGANKDDNIFHVTLHVETEHCENTMTHDVIILPPYPRIEILNQKPAGCVPLTVQFRINQEYCNTFEWNFEDGTTSTEPEPIHEFSEPGIYNVKLTAQGDGGEHYDYEIITVYELPEPEFTTTPKYVMLPDQPVQFFNSTRNGNTYIWDFGDGEYSTQLNPYHQYTKEGIYDVKLIAFSSQMCADSIIKYQDVEVSGAGYIKYPNAFIPSDESPEDGSYPTPDDVDNVFHPIWHGVKEYDLWIFNRWGEQLFHSTDVNVGWNGRYANNGTELGQDVYFWKAKGKFENNVPFKIAGDVTLIRR